MRGTVGLIKAMKISHASRHSCESDARQQCARKNIPAQGDCETGC